MDTQQTQAVLLEIDEYSHKLHYTSSIMSARAQAELEITEIHETIAAVRALQPNCDKTDYALGACSGVVCGFIDSLFVGIPKDSFLGNLTDEWFGQQTCKIAKFCGWNPREGSSVKQAISFLEKKFGVCYDQTGLSDAGKDVFDLKTRNHHFKSLGHHPSIAGLTWSIIDQFHNTSHFVTDGQLIELVDAKEGFKLQGKTTPAKIWCGLVNWIGHILSDMSGSSSSKSRGMGIPSPFMSWVNTVIAIKTKLGIPANEFDKNVYNLALKMFTEGFDFRFQITQCIPVFINELTVRLFYSIRRLIRYYSETQPSERSFKKMWSACKPYNNVSLSRMLLVAHGTFCLMDVGDATIQAFMKGSGQFNPVEFFLRVNIIGVGRFTLSLYSEANREKKHSRIKADADFARRRETIIKDYLDGLTILEEVYDDKEYLSFADDLRNDDHLTAFYKTYALANLRNVPTTDILKTKKEIDNYFNKK